MDYIETLVEHLHVLHNLLVAPVKNPPVAINITQPRLVTTFLPFIFLSFLAQIVFYARQRMIQGVHRVIRGVPPVICGVPPLSGGRPPIIGGAPQIVGGLPQVILGIPSFIVGTPKMVRWSPPITRGQGKYTHFAYFSIMCRILLNKYPFFNTQILPLCLIS